MDASEVIMKKLNFPSELAYLCAILLLSLAVALLSAADFGVSMIVAPAYLLSLKLGFLTFGQAEYVIQAILFVILCLVLKRFRPIYFVSFLTCILYGLVLDGWRRLPLLNPNVTEPGSMGLSLRIVLFLIGVLLTSFSIALFFETYLYPQLYDFFVKSVTERYHLKLSVFKTCFDLTFLLISVLLTFLFFGTIKGIGIGTVIMACINGTLIGFFSGLLKRYVTFPVYAKKLASRF